MLGSHLSSDNTGAETQSENNGASHAFLFHQATTLTTLQKGCLNKSANLGFNEVKAVIKGTFLPLYENDEKKSLFFC